MASIPQNFEWLEPGKLAGMALPDNPADYQYLVANGIKHLICLCELEPPFYETCPEVTMHHVPLENFGPVTMDQIERFLSIVEKCNSDGEAVAVNCNYGRGKTGTMLACYLVKTRGLTGLEGIKEMRRLRYGSVETRFQERAIVEYYERIKNQF